jgi:hypothetical protein
VERLNNSAPYPYAGMIRIRFKGSVRRENSLDISGLMAAPQAFPAGMCDYLNANSEPTTNSIDVMSVLRYLWVGWDSGREALVLLVRAINCFAKQLDIVEPG